MKKSLILFSLLCISSTSFAQIKIGATVSATGTAASLGIPERNTIYLLPKKIADQDVEYIVLDDKSDVTEAVKNTKKLIYEYNVDAILGPSMSSNALAMLDIIAEAKTPMIAFTGSERVVNPVDSKRRWAFTTAQNVRMMAVSLTEFIAENNVKTLAYIGFNDEHGQSWLDNTLIESKKYGINVGPIERYNAGDPSVMGQVLRIVSAKPDAVLIGATGTPAALPQKTLVEKGFKGKVFHSHGSASNDFLRICRSDCEGVYVSSGPVLVHSELPENHPLKKSIDEYVHAYEEKYGENTASTFGAHVWSAGIILKNAITLALKNSKPGTEEFRASLRENVERSKNILTPNGIFNYSEDDHLGLNPESAAVVIKVENGKWKFIK